MINLTGVSKRYGSTAALMDANLQIARGECLGLTGPNGSGRSTLLRILATLIPPSSGLLTIDGIDAVKQVDRVRSRLAYVGEVPVLADPLRSVRVGEYLEFIRRARNMRASRKPDVGMRDVLARAGLAEGLPLGALSAGMRVRVSLAAALSCGADILLLDEPLRWLDADSRGHFLEWLQESRDSGMTLVLALNDHRDMTALCHRIAVLDAGRLTSPSHVLPQSAAAAGLQIAGATSPA
jgi:ABC-2 type transport system ATP-binding protein